MAKLEIQVRENTGATKDSAPYLGHFIHKSQIPFTRLAQEAAVLCGIPAIQLEAIYRGAFNEFAELEKDSATRINFDGGVIAQALRGNFPSSDAAFDASKNSLELAWYLSDDIRNALVNESPRIVTNETSTKVRLDTVADLETPRPYLVIYGRKTFKCTGLNLVMSDEGAEIYLEDALGTKHMCEVVEVISKQEFTAKCVDSLEGGDYKCVVRSRGGDEDGQMQTVMRKVKLIAVNEPVGIKCIAGEGLENGQLDLSKDTTITGWGFSGENVRLRLQFKDADDNEVDETLASGVFSKMTDTELTIPAMAWDDLHDPASEITFTVITDHGEASAKASC